LTLVAAKASGLWARYRADGGARAVDVYVAHDSEPKPVVVLLHGASCTPEFTVDVDGTFHETSIFQDAIAPSLNRVHFAVVERQGVEPLVFAAGSTQAEKRKAFERAEQECTAEYFQTVTKPIRVGDAIAAIRALRQQSWVREVILAGADLFSLEAIRQQPARPIRYVVVEKGNHAFQTPGGRWLVSELFQDFLTWALDANRQTGLAVLQWID
jgi:hypothetical protein